VFEDLHWIDSETQALLESLIESLPTTRLLLLVNYRPEYEHRWGGKTYYVQLRLDPLPPASAGELLDALLAPDASLQPLKPLLIARTEGNPFFLEESVRDLVETKVLTGERGSYHLAKLLPSVQVPATVQAVLAARIDRLAQADKALLQTAAVVGKDVPFTLLRALTDVPEEELGAAIGRLQAAEFLYETTLFPEPEYTFKHALTHEVGYGSLLQERRRTVHALVVEAIERLYSDRLPEYTEQLAHHAFRGEAWQKAVTYCRQAGSKAAGHSAHREAVTHFEHAIVAVQRLPESRDTRNEAVTLRFEIRLSLNTLGEYGPVLHHLREAEALATLLDDPRLLGRVKSYLTQHFWLMGDHDGAVESGQQALAIAEATRDFALRVATYFYLGRAYHALGEYSRAMDLLRANVAVLAGDLIHERFGVAGFPAVLSRTWLIWALAERGDFAEATLRADETVRIAEAGNHPFSLVGALLGIGLLYLREGRPEAAVPHLTRGLELIRVWDIPVWFAYIASHLGYAYLQLDRITQARSLLKEVVNQDPTVRRRADYSLWVAWLGEAHLRSHEIDEATALAERALDLSRAHKERGHAARALCLLGEIAAHHDPPEGEQAEARYRDACALAQELGMRPLMAHCHLGLGKLHRRTGDATKAQEHLTTAATMFRAMDMGFWLEKAEAEKRELT
jgi:tetratricopeptide (TPR) repeat protein